MTLEPRPARREDVAGVHALDRAHGPVFARPEAYGRLVDGAGLLLACGPEGLPVAFAAFSRVLDEASLLNIVVVPEARRSGLASRLLEAARKRLGADGTRHVFLEVRASNRGAVALYRSAGFEAQGRRRAYYPATAGQPAEDALLLRWDLCGAPRDVA